MKSSGWTVVGVACCLTACGSGEPPNAPVTDVATASATDTATSPASSPAETAVANLRAASGSALGTATATPGQGAVLLSLRVEGLPPGEHGIHVHMVGTCEGPKFESAGGHWNPGNKQHGLENPHGQHAGDMPNLTVGADGKGTVSYRLKGATVAGLLDADGSAMVIHADRDDQMTDPSGDSGDRIGCGVFSPG